MSVGIFFLLRPFPLDQKWWIQQWRYACGRSLLLLLVFIRCLWILISICRSFLLDLQLLFLTISLLRQQEWYSLCLDKQLKPLIHGYNWKKYIYWCFWLMNHIKRTLTSLRDNNEQGKGSSWQVYSKTVSEFLPANLQSNFTFWTILFYDILSTAQSF